jgi:hypothetical protein
VTADTRAGFYNKLPHFVCNFLQVLDAKLAKIRR